VKSEHCEPPPGPEEVSSSEALHPLNDFYARAGLEVPGFELVAAQEVPEPFRSLLVHDADMTPTLESFHRARIRIEVLSRHQRGDLYFREVVLALEGSGRPVEFGAIKIDLALFAPGARRDILAAQLPLGRILVEHRIAHTSRPRAVLRVKSDALINRALGLNRATVLYGRRNTLLDTTQRPLAEIVEILPPADDA
jgi:chorismate-pyruvate lyase